MGCRSRLALSGRLVKPAGFSFEIVLPVVFFYGYKKAIGLSRTGTIVHIRFTYIGMSIGTDILSR